jgi:Flp pilus assembly protein TadB
MHQAMITFLLIASVALLPAGVVGIAALGAAAWLWFSQRAHEADDRARRAAFEAEAGRRYDALLREAEDERRQYVERQIRQGNVLPFKRP